MQNTVEIILRYRQVIYILLLTVITAISDSNVSEEYLSNSNSISFFSIGNGDAQLIKSEKSRLLLIDSGPSSSVTEKLNDSLPVSVRFIDYVIITHSHQDHITGLISVLSEYSVGCIIYNLDDPPITNTEKYLRYLIKVNQVKVDYSGTNCHITKDFSVDIYKPNPPVKMLVKNQNSETIITTLSLNGISIYFMGDAENKLQNNIMYN